MWPYHNRLDQLSDRVRKIDSLLNPSIILFVAFLVRILCLGRESFWNDETLTIRDSLKPFSAIVLNRWDPHPPLYYGILHIWLQISQNEIFIRLLSVFLGMAGVVAFYSLIRLFLPRTDSAWGMLLFAVAPSQVWYSQETRMYILVAFWATASVYYWWPALQNKGKWWPYVLVTTAGLYTHYTMGLLLIGQLLFGLSFYFSWPQAYTRAQKLNWSGSQIAILLLYIPWIPQLPKHWQVIRESVNYPIWILSSQPALITFGICLCVLFIALILWQRRPLWLVRSFSFSSETQKRLFFCLSLALVVLYLTLAGATLIDHLGTIKKQTFIAFPFICLLLVIALARFKVWRIWMVGLISISLIITLANAVVLQKPQWRTSVAYLDAHSAEGDILVLIPSWTGATYNYYSQDKIPVVNIQPYDGNEIELDQRENLRIWILINSQTEEWFDRDLAVRSYLTTHYEVIKEEQWGVMQLLLLR